MNKVECVWLIDDDEIFSFAAKMQIEMCSYGNHLSCFENGFDAIEALKKVLKDNAKIPEVIFLDLNMPILDGWQFLDELKELSIPQPIEIYLLTSSTDPADTDKVKDYPMVKKYIAKPLTIDELQNL